MTQTPAQIIEAKGGAASFADAIGVKQSRVRVWKHRNQFPRAYWPEIGRVFPDLGTNALLAAEAAGQTANTNQDAA